MISTIHGELSMQKPINEYAMYMKNLIPANIPEFYDLKPMFIDLASEDNVRRGVVAFRNFLYEFCDHLIESGHLFVQPKLGRKPADYSFLHDINQLLIEIGVHGELSKNKDSLLATIPSFQGKKLTTTQISCLRFLILCGFQFMGIDIEAKAVIMASTSFLEVLYPRNPILLTGLKALSIADVTLRTRRYSNDDNLFRCDYRLLKAEEAEMINVLKDFIHPLPQSLQQFALRLHNRYISKGMTCVFLKDDAIHLAYSYTKNSNRELNTREKYQSRIWEFSLSFKYGYCFVVRSKKTEKYPDVIATFPQYIQEKISQGYGCDRKLRNERCQGGCQGIRFSLNQSILEFEQEIMIWLDNELPIIKTKNMSLLND